MPASAIIPEANPRTHPFRRRWLGSRDYWLLQFASWGLFCCGVCGIQIAQGTRSTNPMDGPVGSVVFIPFCLATSHLLRIQLLWWMRRCQRRHSLVIGIAASAFVTSLGLIGPDLWLTAFFEPPDNPGFDPVTPAAYVARVALYMLGFCVWAGLYFGIFYMRHYRRTLIDRLRIEALAKEAELRALRAQLNPHFIFNSLNSLRALIPAELTRPRDAVTVLADLLRASLTMGAQDTVPLATELETTRNFLALEQLRFQERLRVHWTIAPHASALLVPALSLQGLMENAVKYGVEPFEDGGDITCSVQVREDLLTIEIANRTLANQPSGTRVGLENLRQRLQLLFGTEASLDFEISDGGIATARIVLPALTQPPSTHEGTDHRR